MEYKLTVNRQLSYHDKDGCDRNYITYYLNDVLILKQKIPFDISYERGYDRITSIDDSYILNGKLYQTRYKGWMNDNPKPKVRFVSFPLSKRIIGQFSIPIGLKILLEE